MPCCLARFAEKCKPRQTSCPLVGDHDHLMLRRRSAPFPTAVMFPGYGVTAAHYGNIADRLTSWGYAVIQASLASSPAAVAACAM